MIKDSFARLKTDETLLAAIRAAATHEMTPAEKHAQRRSFVIGQVGGSYPDWPREKIAALVDKVLGTPPPSSEPTPEMMAVGGRIIEEGLFENTDPNDTVFDCAGRVWRAMYALSVAPQFRTGDSILHKPSGETWVCAWADPATGYLSWLGWPAGQAKISDCVLVEAATDADHRKLLGALKRSARPDAERAMRLYGDPDAGEVAR